MKGTILITGSSGRLGSTLIRHFASTHSLVQLDCREPLPELANAGRVHTGSVVDPAVLAAAMEGVDAVIHCGAVPSNIPPFDRLVETNVLGTFRLLEAAGVSPTLERFVFISSICMHGFHSAPPETHAPDALPFNEDHPLLIGDCYATSKLQAESWCRRYAAQYGKPVVALRPSRIVSSDNPAAFPACQPYEKPYLYDYVGMDDMVRAVAHALDYYPAAGFDAFLVNAADQYTEVLSAELAARCYPEARIDAAKLACAGGFGAFVDCSHARKVLGWTPVFRCAR